MKKQLVLGRIRRPDEVQALVERYRSGTQSVRQFAQKQGVTAASVYNWLHRYPTEPTVPATLTEVQVSPRASQSFKASAPAQGYHLLLANGTTLRVPASFDCAEVQSLVQLLANL
jgi:hypothetical protein